MSTHGPVEKEVAQTMQALGEMMAGALPKDYGFTLLIFKKGDEGRMNYISNARREDMLSALKELIANFEGRAHAAPESRQ